MPQPNIIEQEPWSYQLRKEKDTYILNVVLGTIGVYDEDFTLTDEQVARYKSEGREFIEKLVEEIQSKNS